MNILHVVNISFVIPFFLGEQLNYFTKKGFKEYVVCSPSEELESFSERYSFVNLPVAIERKLSFWSDFKAILKVARYLCKYKIDVVVGHTPKGALIAMVAAFVTRIPIRIYFRHGLVYETAVGFKRFLLINIDRLTAKLATKIICVSPSVANKSIKERLNRGNKQFVLGNGTCNGINVDQFNQTSIIKDGSLALQKLLGLENENFVIGYTGRLVKDKGIIDLVDAFNIVKEQCPNARLLLVGMLEERDALPQSLVDTLNSDKSIIMVGYVDNTRMPLYYSLMDIFVLPSYREGFPTSVLEASAMNIPVLTTRATGCVDSIVEGETGFFFNGVEKMAESIVWLYNHPADRIEIGRKGRLFVESKFQQKDIWEEIEKLYHR